MSEILKFNTTQSLYPAVKIEIDGRTYSSKKFTRTERLRFLEFFKEIDKKQKDNPDVEFDGEIYAYVAEIFGVEATLLDQLDVREVGDIVRALTNSLKWNRDTDEKNVTKPGDADSQ